MQDGSFLFRSVGVLLTPIHRVWIRLEGTSWSVTVHNLEEDKFSREKMKGSFSSVLETVSRRLGAAVAFLLVTLLTFGCSSPFDFRLNVEGGIAAPEFGGQSFITNSDNLRDLHAGIGAAHLETTVLEGAGLAIDVGAGPMIWGSHQGELMGAEAVARIRLRLTDVFEPYVVGTAGFAHAEGWHGSDVYYAYTSGLGVGGLYRLSEALALTADWRWLHHSNGMTFHSDGFRHMIGQSKATENDSHQNSAIMVGLVWDF